MSNRQFTGYGGTVEEALGAAATDAAKAWEPAGPDDMVRVQLESIGVLYGGIVGHTGTRVATVSLAERAGVAASAAAGPAMSLRLDVFPEITYADLMPPVRRPQPRKIGFVFMVTNSGNGVFEGQSTDAIVARFSVLHGRTEIWHFPESAATVVTPVVLRPGETKTFTASWEMPDATNLVDADLHVVARFVPSGTSAMQKIRVKAAF